MKIINKLPNNLIQKLTEEASDYNIQQIVAGAVIKKQDKILIIKRSASEDFLPNLEEIPSGKIDIGEDILEGLYREVHEETGLKINTIKQYINHFDYTSGSGKRCRQFNFLVEVITFDKIKLNPSEHSDYRWVSPKSNEFTRLKISNNTKKVFDAIDINTSLTNTKNKYSKK
ncbi:MAG: NUDIX hydrolase [Rickettsiales bacterium]|nr:NUDIX hydrolase [Rickettsiales bacterium]